MDTRILRNPFGSLSFKGVQKEGKLPLHWTSAVPKQYKRNLIKGDFHKACRIESDFQLEWIEIQKKHKRADFLDKFIDSVFDQLDTR